MKIALINGSPKTSGSASGCILQNLRSLLDEEGSVIGEYHLKRPGVSAEEVAALGQSDALVFAFPLYVDGIPSHLLHSLVQLEQSLVKEKQETMVYALANCGFDEGHQNRWALAMMESWCSKAGLMWGQGIGIGAGGMLPAIQSVPLGYGPKKNFGKALQQLAANIANCSADENLFVTANFPKLVYKLAAEAGWVRSAKANGLRWRDLSLRR